MNTNPISDSPSSSTPAPASDGPGRPTTKTPEKLHAVCQFIRMTGLSDTAAAALAGVKRSTLSRWKAEDEEVECALERARAQYLSPRLQSIGETRRKDGELDWRAQAWLVKFAAQGELGRPSPRRKLSEAKVKEEEDKLPETEEETAAMIRQGIREWNAQKPNEPVKVVTVPMQLALIYERRRYQELRWAKEAAAAAAENGAPDEAPARPEAEKRNNSSRNSAAGAQRPPLSI